MCEGELGREFGNESCFGRERWLIVLVSEEKQKVKKVNSDEI
jgi:hypothetical protein